MVDVDGGWFIAHALSLASEVERDRALDAMRVVAEESPFGRAMRAGWIDAFTMSMGVLGANARPEELAVMAEALFPMQGHLDPQHAAEAQFLALKGHDD